VLAPIAAAIVLAAVAPTTHVAASPLTPRVPGEPVPVRNGDYTYTVDIASGAVHVDAHIRVANEGSVGVGTCFTHFVLPVPSGSVDHRAFDRSLELGVEMVAAAGGATVATLAVRLDDCLSYGRQSAIRVTYDIPAGAPRSAAAARITADYVAFVAWSAGRPGGGSIEIVVPTTLTADSLSSDWTVATQGTYTVYTKNPVRDPSTYRVLFGARRASAADAVPVSVDDHRFQLLDAPGDDEWVTHVRGRLTDDLAALEQVIGRPWPYTGTYTIREAYAPVGLAAANWPTDPDATDVGERLDEQGVLYGLAGAWFGSHLFVDQWLAQALARTRAAAAAEGQGIAVDPPAPDSVDAAVAAIVDEIGVEALAEVLGYVERGASAYSFSAPGTEGGDGSDSGPAAPPPVDWREFLDLLEQVGGSQRATDLLTPFVPEADREWLQLRATARRSYADLERRGDDWRPPLGVRQAMAAWAFADAEALIERAMTVLDRRDQLTAALTGSGIDMPDDLRAAYEATTDDFARVAELIGERTSVAPVVVHAAASDKQASGFIAAIGLLGSDARRQLDTALLAFASGDVVTARDNAFAAIDATGSATFEGAKRLILTIGSALAALVAALSIRDIVRYLQLRRAGGALA
jgi:hypothetical protein